MSALSALKCPMGLSSAEGTGSWFLTRAGLRVSFLVAIRVHSSRSLPCPASGTHKQVVCSFSALAGLALLSTPTCITVKFTQETLRKIMK